MSHMLRTSDIEQGANTLFAVAAHVDLSPFRT